MALVAIRLLPSHASSDQISEAERTWALVQGTKGASAVVSAGLKSLGGERGSYTPPPLLSRRPPQHQEATAGYQWFKLFQGLIAFFAKLEVEYEPERIGPKLLHGIRETGPLAAIRRRGAPGGGDAGGDIAASIFRVQIFHA